MVGRPPESGKPAHPIVRPRRWPAERRCGTLGPGMTGPSGAPPSSSLALGFALILVGVASAQGPSIVPAVAPPDHPVVLYTADYRIRVVPIAGGLSHPWGMAFRRNGDILVTERDRGALRIIRNGRLLPQDIDGVPAVFLGTQLAGLMDVSVHPNDDSLVYLTYSKPMMRDGEEGSTVALARGRLEGGALTETRDVFVADGWGKGISASRLLWAPDDTLFMTVGGAFQFDGVGQYAQDGGTHFGKLLRLNDDGTAASDNPFVGRSGYLPEIYSIGHRNQIGLAHHPETGELWATENGVQGGDEANIIKAGHNYGWPMASYSREYGGTPITDIPWRAEFEGPELMWWPSIGPSGLTFYTGNHFPKWRGSLFVGSMRVGGMPRTGHLERVIFNRQGQEIRREWLLTELKQRLRAVMQGPDGLLYVLTDEDDAILFRIEPALAVIDPPGNILTMKRLSEPRATPLPEAEWTADQRATVERYRSGSSPNNALRTLIRAPGMADRVFPLLDYVISKSTLSPRHRALLILRTAWVTQSASLWGSHASRADEAGLTQDDVRRIAEGSDEGWSDFEAGLIGVADELYRNSSLTDRTWQRLSEQYDVLNLVDAVVTVSEITAQAILFNSLGVQPDDDDRFFPMPARSVAYRLEVPDREPALTTARVDPVAGDGLRVSRTLRQHQALADRWYANERYVSSPERSRLTPHDRELLILRTGWNTQSVYEWAKHVGSVGQARDHGLDPAWIAQGGDAPWTPKELALIEAADEMYRDGVISTLTWENLAEHYDAHQLMSVAMTVARYRKVSMTLNALGVQPLPDDETFPVLEGY